MHQGCSARSDIPPIPIFWRVKSRPMTKDISFTLNRSAQIPAWKASRPRETWLIVIIARQSHPREQDAWRRSTRNAGLPVKVFTEFGMQEHVYEFVDRRLMV